ncbi:MAG: ATP-binding protein [Polyangiales bacterium]
MPGEFDPARIGQVLTNLLSNAIKYGRGKPVRVAVERGEALRALHRERRGRRHRAGRSRAGLLERLERLRTTARGASGLGLGPYITRQIVLHGSIAVRSELGAGA